MGGTLWSERLWGSQHFASIRRGRLQESGVPPRALDALVALLDAGAGDESAEYLDIHAWIAERLSEVGLTGLSTEAVRRAWSIPAVEMVPVLPGARELLAGIRRLGLRCYVLSNAFVRTTAEYREDFEAQGLAACVDGYISSVDTLWRKPDPRIFQAALNLAGAPPDRCVMIGNSEAKDVAPARALGMRTVRVAVEEPLPDTSVADHACDSLTSALTSVEQLAGPLY